MPHIGAMQRSLIVSLMFAASLVLSACGTTGPGTDPGPGDPNPGGPGAAECRVTVTDHITIPTTFENGPEDCDYFFPGVDRQYRVSAAMTVEAGTVLRFGRDVILMVTDSGSLQAVGEPDNRIRFEGQLNTTGFWFGICFGDNRASRLENVDILWAGKVYLPATNGCRGAVSGLLSSGEPVDIVNTNVFGAHTIGLNGHNLQLGEFSNNAFGGNLDYGVALEPEQAGRLDPTSDYLGDSLGQRNGRPAVHVGGELGTTGQIHEWHALNAPYVVEKYGYGFTNGLFIDHGAGLVLHPGVEIRFGPDTGLFVWDQSALVTTGSTSDPVVLRGVYDTAGAWPGIWVLNSVVELYGLNIIGAGQAQSTREAALYIDGVFDVLPKWINSLHIEGSTACGLYIDNPELLEEFANISYENNAENYCGN